MKKRRLEREREREERDREREMEQREKEAEYYSAWEKQEDTVSLTIQEFILSILLKMLNVASVFPRST